ncbi:MAG: Bax inhibitor-1/YccA family protein, partial [Ignavibacteriales bacterium]|nr:Bax inhibitor-1/YccA family protein [Ignavibacteriales bacterium]
NKTGMMLLLLIAGAAYTWSLYLEQDPSVTLWMMVGLFGGLIVSFVTIFKKEWSPVTAPLYAVLEGFALGGLSVMLESLYPNIVIQAVALTFGTAGCLLIAYKSGVIKATENFKLGIFAATGGIALIYLVGWIMSFFGTSIPYIHENGLIGIGFSLVVVVIAALNLVLDFDFIEKGAEHGAPKFMEWYAAFGLMVTLIWLYIEILRLLSKLNSRK